MGAFSEAAADWVAAGIAPLPLGGVDGKKPLISRPARLGRRAALELANRPRFANATGLGFWCGQSNGLTVVDIDSTSDAELRHAIDTYGDSPVIVQTASGKAHLYFEYNGERRRIRPDKDHDIDILGEGGLAVAPPSERPAGGRYRFLRGDLGDLRRLPTIRPGAMAQIGHSPRSVPPERNPFSGTRELVANIGQRNNTLFRLALALALTAENRDVLLDQVRMANARQLTPLPDDELQKTVGSAWGYRETGRVMVPGQAESTLILPPSVAKYTMATGNVDVAALMMVVRMHHSEPGKVFALSSAALTAANKINGWSRKRYRYAIREAVNLGLLVLVHAGGRGKHDPSLFKLPLRGL